MNYEFKGTKGKWIREARTVFSLHTPDGKTERNRFYAGFYPDYSSDVPVSEAIANAQLASKAPEMFQMLDKLITAIDEVELSPDSIEILAPLMAETEQLLKQATEL